MVGTKTWSETETASTYLKKVRKPMIEKKRRERMNHSISQLKLLIAQTIKQNTAPMTRVDKADILELTVYHLQQMQRQKRSVTIVTELSGHSAGFKDCAREVTRYLSSRDAVSDATVARLNNHLHNTFQMTSNRHFNVNFLQNLDRRNRLSTPIGKDAPRCLSVDINQLDCSPILECNAQMTPSSPLLTSYTSQGSTYSMNDSYSQDSALSFSSYAETDSRSYASSSTSDHSDVIKIKQEIVTIGTGEENEIGHMISDTPWRPW